MLFAHLKLQWLVLAFAISAAVIGCGEAVGRERLTRPEYGGMVRRRLAADPTTLNPVRATTIEDRYVAEYLFTPLIRLDRQLAAIPGLAKSWQISADGRAYKFSLDERATFSDGTHVTATDVLFTLRKAVDPTSLAPQIGSSFSSLDLSGTTVIDQHTIRVSFKTRDAGQTLEFNRLMVVPEHIYGRGTFCDDFNDRAIGSGPYRLLEWDHSTLTLEKRRDYWDRAPYPDRIVFKVISADETAWRALETGMIDETFISSETWYRYRVSAPKSIVFRPFFTLNYNMIAWNERREIFRDRRVRRALAMCVPIEAILREVYHGMARRMTGPFVPGTYANNRAVPPVPFDPTLAIRLLGQAGWFRSASGIMERGSEKLAFDLNIEAGNSADQTLALVFQDQLRRIGVQMSVVPMEQTTRVKRMLSGDYDAATLGVSVGPEPRPRTFLRSGEYLNIVSFSDPESDRLIDAAEDEPDVSRRRAILWKLHSRVAAEQPYTWLIQVSEKWALNARVQGVETSAGFGLFRWYPGELQWWLTDSSRAK